MYLHILQIYLICRYIAYIAYISEYIIHIFLDILHIYLPIFCKFCIFCVYSAYTAYISAYDAYFLARAGYNPVNSGFSIALFKEQCSCLQIIPLITPITGKLIHKQAHP